jgi:hypothetical protein
MRPSVQQPISMYKNVMERKHYLKKQLFDFDVKGQGPMKVITVCDTPPYGHARLDHNLFVFPDRSIIFGMWVHDHKAVCHIP